MRAISTFTLESGISTLSCSAPCALRMRASMSAMGSVMDMSSAPLPARLGDAWNLPAVGEVPEAQAAHGVLAEVGARATAPLAAVVAPHLELGRFACLDDERLLYHMYDPHWSERGT